MDLELTPEQKALHDGVVRFARGELNEGLEQREHDAVFSREGWQKCAEFGLQGLPVPKDYGGAGADVLTTLVALEALGYACEDNGLIFSLNAQLWSCEIPILRFGTEEQKRRYLPGLCDGSLIAAHGLSEPEAGSDALSLSTTAVPEGDGWILNGSKTFVTNAPEAGLFVIFATTDRSRGFAGLCAFLVDRETPGLSLGRPISKMGLRTSPMSEVFLADCRVPGGQLLGSRGGGLRVFDTALTWERSCILASAVGTMQRQLERTIEQARNRRQYGQPIGKFQAVSRRIVDMKLRLETSRLLLYRIAWLLDRGEDVGLDSALAKIYLSESYVRSSLDALQVFGGYGYTTEYGLEREVRDALGSRIYSGTSDIQYNIAARHLGL